MDLSASFFRSKTDGDLALVCWGHHHFAKITNARQLRAMPAIVGLLINSGFTHFTNLNSFSRSLALMPRSASHSWPKERGPSSVTSPATAGTTGPADISICRLSTGELWKKAACKPSPAGWQTNLPFNRYLKQVFMKILKWTSSLCDATCFHLLISNDTSSGIWNIDSHKRDGTTWKIPG